MRLGCCEWIVKEGEMCRKGGFGKKVEGKEVVYNRRVGIKKGCRIYMYKIIEWKNLCLLKYIKVKIIIDYTCHNF